MLQKRYGVPVNWFCYPSGDYDATVIAAVKAAGFVGSTTVVPGWARAKRAIPTGSRGCACWAGTSPSGLLAQITDAQRSAAAPSSYTA